MGKKHQNKRVRNRSSNSSISDLDISVSTKKQKKTLSEDSQDTSIHETSEEMAESKKSDITEQLKQINKKLENVITKEDQFLKNLIKDIILEMRSEFFSSIEKKLEVMEAEIFDYMKENAQLKSQVVELQKKIENKDDIQSNRINKIEGVVRSNEEKQNEQAQYSRRNNVRIYGIPETHGETAVQTAEKVAKKLNEKIPGFKLTINDIDIAHRIGKIPNPHVKKTNTTETESVLLNNVEQYKGEESSENKQSKNENKEISGKREDENRKKNEESETFAELLKQKENEESTGARQIIIRFISRMKRDELLRNRKYLKGSNIFVNEDLTRLNNRVLMTIKKGNPNKIQNAWTKDGKIFYKNFQGDVIYVPYQEYHEWLNVSWNNVR